MSNIGKIHDYEYDIVRGKWKLLIILEDYEPPEYDPYKKVIFPKEIIIA